MVADITPPSIPQLKVSPNNQQELQHLSDILHLLHHRNHNQHRRSSWYRHFSIFRRHLSTLLLHLAVLAEQPTTNLAKHRKKVTDARTHASIQADLAFWRDVLMPKWQHAFAQVVADGRFAVLGVVLLAALAQVGRIVGLDRIYESMGELEIQRVLEQFARDEWVGDDGGDDGVEVERKVGDEDFGEAVLRRDDESVDGGAEDARITEKELRLGENSKCMAPEQDVLKQSREALMKPKPESMSPALDVSTIDSLPPTAMEKKSKISRDVEEASKRKGKSEKNKRPAAETPLSIPKPPKKKKKKNAIDELFSGL